ncbi:MAG: PIN domain-containing protein [Acidobacteria bacterium]|nr:PIN domain-containing protein [Acidobacteriota bacterium]
MILIDTGPLVALCDPRDGLHTAAMQHLEDLARIPLCTCEAVLVEACFHLPHRAQRQRLRALLEHLNIAPASSVGDYAFWAAVFHWLAQYAEHEPDWADGCIAVLCGQEKGLKVWTYDREFRTTWRRPDGTAIPMAVRAERRR